MGFTFEATTKAADAPDIEGGMYDPLHVDGLTSKSLNVLSETQPRAVRYLKALLTEGEFDSFKEGNGFDAAGLNERKAQVEVAINAKGWPQIVNVLPARRRRSATRRTTNEGDEA
jgi:diphthamide synthase subunit DPH2